MSGSDGPEVTVTGTPTARQRALRAAADELTPAHALDAVDQAAGRITGAVTLAGTIAGGVGLVSASELSGVGIGWGLPSVFAAGLSVALAVIATVPVRATVRPGDLSAMEWWFERQLTRRVRLIHAAAVLLGIAVLCAALPPTVAALDDETPAVDLDVAVGGSGKVAVSVKATDITDHAQLQLVILEGAKPLARGFADASGDGRAELSLAVVAHSGHSLSLRVVVREGSRVITSRTTSVAVP